MTPKYEGVERRAEGAEGAHVRIVRELQEYSNKNFDAGVVRMGVIEARIGKHTELLLGLGTRFDNFESALNVERRLNEAAIAKKLNEWNDFTRLKFDEYGSRTQIIEDNQALHMKSTAEVQDGIGTLLEIVSAMQTVKKTVNRFGRCGLWVGSKAGRLILYAGGLAAAVVAIRAAFTSNLKAIWALL